MIPASVQIAATALASLAIPRGFITKSRWLPLSRFTLVALCLILLMTAAAFQASLIFRAGDCQSLEQLDIDDIDWAYKCTLIPRPESDRLNDRMGWIGLLSFGWPHLLCVAVVLETVARRRAKA